MPIGFLTAAERERLDRFPEQIPDDDLFVYFRLSERFLIQRPSFTNQHVRTALRD